MFFILDEYDFTLISVSNEEGLNWGHNLFSHIQHKWPTYETKDHYIFILFGNNQNNQYNLFSVHILIKTPVFRHIHERFNTYIEALDFMESYIDDIYI